MDAQKKHLDALAASLRPDDEKLFLYAVMDACKCYSVLNSAMRNGALCVPLLPGYCDHTMHKELPWLISCEDEQVFRCLLAGFGDGWGIFLHSADAFDNLVEHFRTLPTALLPEGGKTWLRYYAPCFLASIARHGGEWNLKRLFSDKVHAFFAEEPDNPGFMRLDTVSEYKKPVSPQLPFKLTAELLEHLDAARIQELVRQLREYYLALPHTAPAESAAELHELEIRLADMVEQASGYEITDLKSLKIYTDSAVRWGWDFNTSHTASQAALASKGAPGWMRAGFLRQILENSW